MATTRDPDREGAAGWRERLLERFPEVQRRDAELAQLREQLATTQSRLTALEQARRRDAAHPSFRHEIYALRRISEEMVALDPQRRHPARPLPYKLATHRFARSHGMPLPELYRVWGTLGEVTLEGLPDAVVVKSDGGAGMRGVLPLRRQPEGDLLDLLTGARLTDAQISERLDSPTMIRPPFLAEELLSGLGEREGVPADVKVYCFYGEVGHIVVITRDPERGALYRYFDETGADLGDVGGRAIDASVPPPRDMPTLVEMARHLSRASGVPFCRIDLYETDRGPVVGELTRAPGGPHRYRRGHGRHLGRLWEQARTRLELDLAAGRPFGRLLGAQPAPDPYEGVSPEWVAASADLPVLDCERWCLA